MTRRTQHVLRFLLWIVAPLDERLRGLSLVRVLSMACFVFVGHTVWEEQRLSWVDYNVLLLGVASAMGKKLVYALITRNHPAPPPKDMEQTMERGMEDGP